MVRLVDLQVRFLPASGVSHYPPDMHVVHRGERAPMRTADLLKKIETDIDSKTIPRSTRLWGGADVVIVKRTPADSLGGGFYPEPRSVVTQHARELSWLFERLRDAFYAEHRVDWETKIEFFGRLANAANRALKSSPGINARVLCAAVLQEALAILDEMEDGTFRSLPVAVGNEIFDDQVDGARRSGFTDVQATREFFAKRGTDLD